MRVIRSYERADLDLMVALDAQCFEPQLLFGRVSMRRFAEARHAIALVTYAGGEMLAGFVIVHLGPVDSAIRGYVVSLDVAASQRRTGLAGRLLMRAEGQAAVGGAGHMDLHVSTQNENAILFYEKHGYIRVDVDRGFYGIGHDAYIYSKEIRPLR